jgi:hypothetical protein
MKLRIQSNSMRLRVSRSELARLLAGERIEETVRFARASDARLTYALSSARQDVAARVEYHRGSVTVLLSEEQLKFWGREDQVGIYVALPMDSGYSLAVTIEKDFACLDRPAEENTDTFANPHAGSVC